MGRLAEDWRTLRNGTPGRRFYDSYRARTERRGQGWPLERILTLALALILIVGGLAVGWLPGPGGFIGLIGVALLAAESLRVSRLLDRIELRLRGAWRSVRSRMLGRPTPDSEPPGE